MKKPYWNLFVTILAIYGCFSCWRGWNRGVAKGMVEYVLKSDAECETWLSKQISTLEFASDEQFDRAVEMVGTRVAAERRLNITRCPPDFQVAFIRYLGAWDNFATAISSHPHVYGKLEGSVTGFLQGLRGDFGGADRFVKEVNDWRRVLAQRIAEVDTAKTELDALAVKYEASLPPR